MKFGEIPVGQALGAILAHSVSHTGGVFKKGRVLSERDIAELADGGIGSVYVAQLEADDVGEDEAAQIIAGALAGDNTRVRDAATGRANIMSALDGVACIDVQRINQLNLIDESLTVATVGAFEVAGAGQILATVKVIPYAVKRGVLDIALDILADQPALSVQPLENRKVALIMTSVPGMKASLHEKSQAAMRGRLEALGSTLDEVKITEHRIEAVAAAITAAAPAHDLVLVFGASAIADRKDVIPAGLVEAGGEVVHLGMPVDPGNLMMLGRLGAIDVIGVPSCARSPKVNGFDWVLARILAGLDVTSGDIMGMGVGGLLKEIASRPAPREAGPR
ncbi:MAG: molybdopterin-binding protein [Rhizobiales bacterium]|nr:molybdopterin-binding protein [Hyphomicrobiales bacterium]